MNLNAKSLYAIGFIFFLAACGKTSQVNQDTEMKAWQVTQSEVDAYLAQSSKARGAVSAETCSQVINTASEITVRTCNSSERPLRTLLSQAATEITNGIYAGNNVYAIGIAHSITSEQGFTQCAFVQVQQRYQGRIVASKVMTPPNQPANCVVKQGSVNFYGVSVGFFGKVGANVFGGVGGGIGWENWSYFKPVNAVIPVFTGCLAGAAGVASKTFNLATGVAGYTCGRIPLY